MAQKRYAISKVVGEVYELRSETSGECRKFDTLGEVARFLKEDRLRLPQVDIHIRTDVPYDIVWPVGRSAQRYRRLDAEELDGVFQAIIEP